LHYLALYGTTPEDLKLARQLIINGANINAQDDSKVTPLMLAAQGNADFVKLLVDRGASINLRSKKKLTALSYARQTLDELKKNRTEENAVRIMQLEHIVKYLQEAQVRKSAHKRAASGALARELKEGDGEERMHEENEEEESEEAQADEEAYNKSGWTII
jgi:ankyrin repeat protein